VQPGTEKRSNGAEEGRFADLIPSEKQEDRGDLSRTINRVTSDSGWRFKSPRGEEPNGLPFETPDETATATA